MMAGTEDMAEFERIVIGRGDASTGMLVVDPAQVWFLSLEDHLVGVLDGEETYLARSREPIELRTAPSTPGPEPRGVPVWDSRGTPLISVPLGALAAEEAREIPRLQAVAEAGDRIMADVRAGRLSPFVLQRFVRRAAELQLRLVKEGRERDAPREAAVLEAELRSGAAR
jgi:hypothetical protein